MKKLNKRVRSRYETIESYSSCTCYCGNCSCFCTTSDYAYDMGAQRMNDDLGLFASRMQ